MYILWHKSKNVNMCKFYVEYIKKLWSYTLSWVPLSWIEMIRKIYFKYISCNEIKKYEIKIFRKKFPNISCSMTSTKLPSDCRQWGVSFSFQQIKISLAVSSKQEILFFRNQFFSWGQNFFNLSTKTAFIEPVITCAYIHKFR